MTTLGRHRPSFQASQRGVLAFDRWSSSIHRRPWRSSDYKVKLQKAFGGGQVGVVDMTSCATGVPTGPLRSPSPVAFAAPHDAPHSPPIRWTRRPTNGAALHDAVRNNKPFQTKRHHQIGKDRIAQPGKFHYKPYLNRAHLLLLRGEIYCCLTQTIF